MQPLAALATVDLLVHEPTRLTILTLLSLQDGADSAALQSVTGISRASLSRHLARLAEAGLVHVARAPRGKQSIPTFTLTAAGRAAVEQHWQQLEAARRHVQFALARRYLDAPEGSDEQLLAGATLSATLAQEQGRSLPERGGDARVAFARLRA